jgi:crossover junction endodeoxyribonuclease RusA
VSDAYSITLPYPPSVNGYWRSFRGRQIISKRGREYREQVVAAVLSNVNRRKFEGRLEVVAELWVPDRRRRDIDNALKALLDSATHAGLWNDDSQIDDLRVIRVGYTPGGLVVLRIKELL